MGSCLSVGRKNNTRSLSSNTSSQYSNDEIDRGQFRGHAYDLYCTGGGGVLKDRARFTPPYTTSQPCIPKSSHTSYENDINSIDSNIEFIMPQELDGKDFHAHRSKPRPEASRPLTTEEMFKHSTHLRQRLYLLRFLKDTNQTP